MKTDKTSPKRKLRKNDAVCVITGKDKGKQGKILEIDVEKQRVLVEGVNYLTHYERPSQQNQKGGISKKEGFIACSNVQLYCPKCNKPVRTRCGNIEQGTKNRICVKCGDII